MNKISLQNYFDQYIKIMESGKTVPDNFWTKVSNYWSNTEGNEHLSNDSSRKRFKRRYKKLERANFSNDVLKDIYSDLEKDDRTFEGDLEADLFEDLDEFESETDWEEKVEEEGVTGEYQNFLKKHGIDPEDVVNVYFKEKASGTRFTVQTRRKDEELNREEYIEEFKNAIEEYEVPDYSHVFDKSDFDYMERVCVVNAYDAHLDKITYLDTTDESSSLEGNINKFREAFNKILKHVITSQPELIIFPVGNDFFHVNGSDLETKKGTPMKGSVHPNHKESFRKGLNLIRESIDKLRYIAPVEVRFVRGNHDDDQIPYLLECLMIAYENQEDVNVIDSIKKRQYKRYGNCLFGFAHGDLERKASALPSRMATDKESKQHWSEIDFAVYFLGDIHHEKRYKFMEAIDFQGVHVKFLRSMSQTDTWHWEKGFNGGLKTIYCFVYSKDGKDEFEFKKNI